MSARLRLAAALAVAGCAQDYRVREKDEEAVPVEQPDPDSGDDHGDAPDWANCPGGYLAVLYNLPSDHPDVTPELWEEPPFDTAALDWWDPARQVTERFEPSLDLGDNWWPVDEGLDDDPAYFTAVFSAWIRVVQGGPATFSFGASTDLWMMLDGRTVARRHGDGEWAPAQEVIDLQPGQYELELRFAHRFGTSGLQFRLIDGDVQLCYPDFTSDAARAPAGDAAAPPAGLRADLEGP